MSGQIQNVVTPSGVLPLVRQTAEKLLREGVISGTLDGALHAADAATVKAAIMAANVCDFCSVPGATHFYDVPDFGISLLPGNMGQSRPGGPREGGWTACDACHDLIQANKRAQLVDRAVATMAFPKFSRRMLEEMLAKFWQGMDDTVDAVGTAAAFSDFIEDRLKHPIASREKFSTRALRIQAIARLTGLTKDQIAAIPRSMSAARSSSVNRIAVADENPRLDRETIQKLAAWHRRFDRDLKGASQNQLVDYVRLLAGDEQHKPLLAPAPHWQRALDMKFAALDRTARLAADGVPAQFFSPNETDLRDPAALRRVLATSEQARQTYAAQNRADAKALQYAEAYSFNAETLAAIAAAAPSYDALDPTAASVDTPGGGRAGWFWFGEPLAVTTSGEAIGTSALLWYWDENREDEGPEIRFSAFGVDGAGDIVPAAYWRWRLAQTFHGLLAEVAAAHDEGLVLVASDNPLGREAMLKGIAELTLFFVAACVWMKQRILVAGPGHVERHERKRMQKKHKLAEPPAVQVIALRRSVREAAGAEPPRGEPGAGHKMTVRFIVSGHPRLQRCGPGRKDVKLIWIAPFEKGPEGAPLRVRKRVYAVVR